MVFLKLKSEESSLSMAQYKVNLFNKRSTQNGMCAYIRYVWIYLHSSDDLRVDEASITYYL